MVHRDPFSRPSAPLLDFDAADPPPADGAAPSCPRQHSLRDLCGADDPLLVPALVSGETELPVAVDTDALDECPPTVRTPRLRSAAPADRSVPACPVAAVEHREQTVLVAEAAPEDPPDSLRVAGEEADFFRFESFPPVVEDLEAPESDGSLPSPPSPEQLARTAMLRRGVGAVVALAAVFAIVAVIIGAVGSSHASSTAPAQGRHATAGEPAAPPHAAEPAQPGTADRLATPAAPAADSEQVALAVAELRAQAVEALSAQQLERAEQLARQLVAAEPDHAFGYRCLGGALQDQGRWAEALEVYGACVRSAERGDVEECAALGGRK